MNIIKRLISILAVFALIPGIPVFSASHNTHINVAEGKSIKAVSGGYTLDLGRSYPIESIEIEGRRTENASVTVSNDSAFSTGTSATSNAVVGKKVLSKLYGAGGYLTHTVDLATDGDTSTCFVSTPVNYTDVEWITVDMYKPVTIDYVSTKFYFPGSKRPYDVYVTNTQYGQTEEMTDGVKLVTVNGKLTVPEEYKNTKFRYARLRMDAAGDESGKDFYVYDFSVYTKDKTVPYTTTETLIKKDGAYVPDYETKKQYYRYVKVAGAFLSVSDIKVYADSESTTFENAAKNAQITVPDGANVWESYPKENSVDFNISTLTAMNHHNPYLQFDLKKPMQISHAEIYCRQDMNDDRNGIKILASNDSDFSDYDIIGAQNDEIIGQKAAFVRVNKNPLEKYRYVRVYEGGEKAFLILADVGIFAREGKDVLRDAAYGKIPTVDTNESVAYRICDNDKISAWTGNSLSLNLGHCHKTDSLSITAIGNVNITAYCEEGASVNLSESFYPMETKIFDINSNISAIEIKSADDEEITVSDVRVSISGGDDALIKAEATAKTDGDYRVYDLGKAMLIDHVEPCNISFEVSKNSDFSNSTKRDIHDGKLSSGRYVRCNVSDGAISIFTLKNPVVVTDGENAVMEYETSQYMDGYNDTAIAAAYSDGYLSDVKMGEVNGGRIELSKASEDSKLMVWKSADDMTPTIAAQKSEYKNTAPWGELYVDPTKGDDSNDASADAPVRTIERAKEIVRSINSSMQSDIVVYLKGGRYYLEKPLEFTISDGGKNSHRVIYKNAEGETPVITGGRKITGFVEGEKGIWSADASEFDSIYELTVNGRGAITARTNTPIKAVEFYNNGLGYERDGISFSKSQLPMLSNPEDVIVHCTRSWMDTIVKCTGIQSVDGTINLNMSQPSFEEITAPNALSGHAVTPSSDFVVENAFELLDMPGEFYFNRKTKRIYYMPREGEDMKNAHVEGAYLDRLVHIKGNGVDEHIENLTLSGIRFENSTFRKLYSFGIVTGQAQNVTNNGMQDRFIDGAIQMDYATAVEISDCEITNVTKTAISLGEGVVKAEIKDNYIHDVGDGAVVVGRLWHDVINKPTTLKGDFDCFTRKSVWASSGTTYNLWEQKTDNVTNTSNGWLSWQSHESDLKRNIKPWIIIDLGKPYSIKSVYLYATTRQGNFEVLASNDETFSDSVSLGSTQGAVRSFSSASTNGVKYQYIKIAKTALESFSIENIKVFTTDESIRQIEELCVGNRICNNKIVRTGLVNKGAPAICGYYVTDTEIMNNNIEDSNYSAISLGWGWSYYKHSVTCRGNKVKNNYIRNFNLVATDGGAVYTLGQQTGTIIEGNYILQEVKAGQNTGNVGIYPDEGSQYMTVRNNVIDMSGAGDNNVYSISLWIDTITDMQVHSNYATVDNVRNNGTNCIVDAPIMYKKGNMPREAEKIAERAGVH